jgi:hypothetical protein
MSFPSLSKSRSFPPCVRASASVPCPPYRYRKAVARVALRVARGCAELHDRKYRVFNEKRRVIRHAMADKALAALRQVGKNLSKPK